MGNPSVGGRVLVLRMSGYSGLVVRTNHVVKGTGVRYYSVECTLENARCEVGKADLVIFVGEVTDEAIAVLGEIWEKTGLPIFFVVEGDPGRRLEKFSGLVVFSAADEPLETLEARIREELTLVEYEGGEGLEPQERLPDVLINLTTDEAVILGRENIPLRHRLWFLEDSCLSQLVSWMGQTMEIVSDTIVNLDGAPRRIIVVESNSNAPSNLPERPSLLPVEFELVVEPASALANLE